MKNLAYWLELGFVHAPQQISGFVGGRIKINFMAQRYEYHFLAVQTILLYS